jgi:hypothetical protein
MPGWRASECTFNEAGGFKEEEYQGPNPSRPGVLRTREKELGEGGHRQAMFTDYDPLDWSFCGLCMSWSGWKMPQTNQPWVAWSRV